MKTHGQCAQSQYLSRLVEDELAENERTQLESHLETCETCQNALDVLVDNDEVTQRVSAHLREPHVVSNRALLELVDRIRSTTCGTDAREAVPLDDFAVDYLQASDNPNAIGRLGRYDVMEVIGRGGMGIVLKGHDGRLNRVVAIKVLGPTFALNSTARKRFMREAQAAATVGHPNVVAIHSVGEERLPYLVMEFVDGPSLQQRLDADGFLNVSQILRIGVQVTAGLEAAHAQGLVHRDIKPGNILLGNGMERVKLSDFGLARAADDASVTRDGTVVGTPQYMSPEQARGEPVDQTSDLFSLGSVLYTLATGRPPFRAESSYGVLRKITDNTAKPIRELNPEIPAWLCAIIDKLMAKDKSERFQSISEVHELLQSCLSHTQQPTVTSLPKIPGRPSEERAFPVLKPLLGVSTAMITIAASLVFAFGFPSTQPSKQETTPNKTGQPSYTKEFVVDFPKPGEIGTLNVDIKRGSIHVTGYDGDKIQVELTVPNYPTSSSGSPDGLKQVRANTLDFDIEKSGDQVKLDGNSYQYITNLSIKVPRKTNLILDSYQDGSLHVEAVQGTFKLRSHNNNIRVQQVSGTGRLWSYNGSLSADFESVTKDRPLELETYNGSIDLKLPSDSNLDVKYRSGSGDVFTDFEMALGDDKVRVASNGDVGFDEFVHGKINGGGISLKLETEKGDIRLRKRMNESIR